MKRRLLFLTSLALAAVSVDAQEIADFENLPLSEGSYWTGTASSGDSTFTSGDASFPNKFSSYWEKGWAYSNIKDSTTVGYTNNYGARPATGFGGSSNYAVGKNEAIINIGRGGIQEVEGLYITNGTYAALSMENGDQFAKKFGGSTGNDPDYLLLTIKSYHSGGPPQDSLKFYLADFRFSDNSLDYIVKDWRWIDLRGFGQIEELEFILSSSDVGEWGMNTPAFFCIDNFTSHEIPFSVSTVNEEVITVYPNPATNFITVKDVDVNSKLSIWNSLGVLVSEKLVKSSTCTVDIGKFERGIYFINVRLNGVLYQRKVVKN